jgi:Serine hydroxymethyltransferase
VRRPWRRSFAPERWLAQEVESARRSDRRGRSASVSSKEVLMSVLTQIDPLLENADPEVAALVSEEIERQSTTICLIPSENYVSRAVLEAMGSVFTNKYSEGYAGRRYYEGQQVVDRLEPLAVERAKRLFGVEHANVQPYSGSLLSPAKVATSSRRSPGTRRWPNDVIPTSSGVIRARLDVRKSRISVLMSTSEA